MLCLQLLRTKDVQNQNPFIEQTQNNKLRNILTNNNLLLRNNWTDVYKLHIFLWKTASATE